ncbi:hypothetical protein H4R20_004443 [Coemansia guatemalensis]|uniref:Thioesterase domain-containing protein n=1 Tax=Coemansia guatemalensis TaxID=2761395 RepID=A0A9W8HXK8_9FUNG|nr:hypothetical protein H4R20_004443 [Coemansia guatemalensis]
MLSSETQKSAADIIRERTSLAAFQELLSNPAAKPIDIMAELEGSTSCENHFGFKEISRVMPFAFGWDGSANAYMEQLITSKIPPERLPGSQFNTPMVTVFDYINENVCGHPGLIHGGMTATIAHTTMSLAAVLNAPKGARVFSKSLNMDYRKPIYTGNFVKIHAWLYQREQDDLKAALQIHSLEDEMLVEATSSLAIKSL